MAGYCPWARQECKAITKLEQQVAVITKERADIQSATIRKDKELAAANARIAEARRVHELYYRICEEYYHDRDTGNFWFYNTWLDVVWGDSMRHAYRDVMIKVLGGGTEGEQ